MFAASTLRTLLQRHQTRLFWLHSAWSMALGIGMMWIGARHYAYLRIAFFHIAFIWTSSLFLPYLARIPNLSHAWHERLRLLINYFNRNFYQQFLFFILPLYYASTTLFSRAMFFLPLLACTTVLATLDVVYDRILTRRWLLLALFFSFNLFACTYAMLPLLWGLSYRLAARICAAVASLAFTSFCLRYATWRRQRKILACMVSMLLLFLISEAGLPFLPPVPLHLGNTIMGNGFDAATRTILGQTSTASRVPNQRLFIQTAIIAPLGLSDRLRHTWLLDGHEIYASPVFPVAGGRREGFRLHTSNTLPPCRAGTTLSIEVSNEYGQLVGRFSTVVE
jgi:hypothetical protein